MDKERTKENARRTPGKLRKKKDRPAGKAGRCGQSITQRIEFFTAFSVYQAGSRDASRTGSPPEIIPPYCTKKHTGPEPLPSVSGAAAGWQQKRLWRRGIGSMVPLYPFGREFVHHDSKTPSRGSQGHVKRPVNARKRDTMPAMSAVVIRCRIPCGG